MTEKWVLVGYPCPNCGEYGGAYAVRNRKNGRLLAYCDECDCLWLTPEAVARNDVWEARQGQFE